MVCFTPSHLEAIADALGDTDEGLKGAEIHHLLQSCGILDVDPANTKRIRLYNAFATHQNQVQDRTKILGFIRKAMKPERFIRCKERFEPMRANLNVALAFAGLAVDASGTLIGVEVVNTLNDAERRANALKANLIKREVHSDVLEFCKSELLADNYFHAVLEATKSIADKIRQRTGLSEDGAALIDRALCGDIPMLAINPLQTESQKSEQKGFANLLKGVFGMFRNPTAHEARIRWEMSIDDAEDLLSLVSLIHRRIDTSHMPPRV
jgi:uncharacterized protein (TIGR02391 family)